MLMNPRLLLCMSPGVGLGTWADRGILEREIQPYQYYVANGWRVTIATYDSPSQVPVLPAGFSVVFQRQTWRACWTLRNAIRDSDLVRTNQAGRAWWYVFAARTFQKPILVRCGWVPGSYRAIAEGGVNIRLRMLRLAEAWAFRNATACQVATPEDREWLIAKYGVAPRSIHLRPNYVDCDLFIPASEPPRPRSVVCVGRLDPVKRLDLLIRACRYSGVELLTLIGEGPDRTRLEKLAEEACLRVDFRGAVPQKDLARILQQSSVFALVSRVEGHPKALLEAMACGMACIGTNTPGIRQVLVDGESGLLAGERPEDLARIMSMVLADSPLRVRLGSAARQQIVEKFALPKVLAKELELANSLVASVREGHRESGNFKS